MSSANAERIPFYEPTVPVRGYSIPIRAAVQCSRLKGSNEEGMKKTAARVIVVTEFSLQWCRTGKKLKRHTLL